VLANQLAINIRSKGQRSRSQGHKVQKMRSSGRRELCTLSSAQPLIWLCIYLAQQLPNTAEAFASSGDCKTRPVSVPLQPPQDDDANTFYYPSCTEVMRCSGCCSGFQPHTCMPVSTETVELQVTPSPVVSTGILTHGRPTSSDFWFRPSGLDLYV